MHGNYIGLILIAKMIKAKKILFITQEIAPYVDESVYTPLGRMLPQATQEQRREIRTFSPKWGNINERRHMLHEVIRLSGMNLIIDDTDHPLIIKVASIQAARLQVYFIDNEDYFNKRGAMCNDKGEEYADNAERAVFYARGVLETVKKLRWVPDVIHCQGWVSSIVPLYLKTAFADEPCFRDTKIVYSPIDLPLTKAPGKEFANALRFRSADSSAIEEYGDMQASDLQLLGIKYADGVTFANEDDKELIEYANKNDKKVLIAPDTEYKLYTDFFDHVWGDGKEEEEEEDDF